MRHLDTSGELCYLEDGPIFVPSLTSLGQQRDPGAVCPNIDKIFDLQDWCKTLLYHMSVATWQDDVGVQ